MRGLIGERSPVFLLSRSISRAAFQLKVRVKGEAPDMVRSASQVIDPNQVGPERKRLGLSQSELARRSGVSQSFIAKMEAGLIDPAFSKMRAISSVLEAIERTSQGRTAAEL